MFTILGLFFGNPFFFIAKTFRSDLVPSGIYLTVSGLFLILMCFFPVAPNDKPRSLYAFQQYVKHDPEMKLILYPIMAGSLIDGLAHLLLWLLTS